MSIVSPICTGGSGAPGSGIDIRCLGFSPYRSPGSELIWQWASANGIPGSEAPLEMARRLGLKLYLKQRLLFSEKANYVRLGAVPFPLQLDILPSPLGPLGFRQEAFFPYTTPDGKSASGGVAYLRDDEGIQSGFPSPRGKTNFVRFCGIGSLGGLHSLCSTYTSFLLVETPRLHPSDRKGRGLAPPECGLASLSIR